MVSSPPPTRERWGRRAGDKPNLGFEYQHSSCTLAQFWPAPELELLGLLLGASSDPVRAGPGWGETWAEDGQQHRLGIDS